MLVIRKPLLFPRQFGSHVIDLLHYFGLRADRVHGTVKTLKKVTRKINGIRQIQADDFAAFQVSLNSNEKPKPLVLWIHIGTTFMKEGLDGKKKMQGKSQGAMQTGSFRALKRAPT